MKLFPYNRFNIESEKSPDEVIKKVSEYVGEKEFFSFKPAKEFSGSIHSNEFKIQKNISYRNSFLPIIEGVVKPNGDGTITDIKMRLNSLVFGFMCIWFFGVGVGCIAVLSNLDSFSFHALIPFGMLVFGVALVNGGFWVEASKQKVRLIEIIKKT